MLPSRKLASLKNAILLLFFGLILLISAFTRLWNIEGTLEFLGDQGRDALLVRRIFADLDPVFIGPVTSVGNMYLGPMYYYFMLPFLMISYPSPVGPAVAVAVLSIITTGLMVILGKKLIGLPASFLSAVLFSIHAVVIQYSRFSWNPNPAPFIALLMVYWTYKAWTKNVNYWILVALAFSILIQLHYITILSGVGASVIFLIQIGEAYFKKSQFLKITDSLPNQSQNNKINPSSNKFVSVLSNSTNFKQKLTYHPKISTLLKMIPIGALVVILTLSPLFLFDLKNGGLNRTAFSNILFKENTFQDSKKPFYSNLMQSILETQGRSIHLLGELNFGSNRSLNQILIGLFFVTSFVILINRKDKHRSGFFVIIVYLTVGIVGTSFYRGSLFNHYVTYLFPIILLAWSYVFKQWLRWSVVAVIPVSILLGVFFQYNLSNLNFESRDWGLQQLEDTTNSIIENLNQDRPFTLVLLSPTGDLHGMNYRYYLTTKGFPPLGFESIQKAQTMVIINEDQPNFDPKQSDIHELKIFPSTSSEFRYTIKDGPEIIILNK
jgi:hypothetical protein